ncbi:MAG: hypothetical protein HRU82_02065 [Nitrospira sp.]|nr:MAG: hypothetical protein HRU82_02065 [Nitrospira sp.]
MQDGPKQLRRRKALQFALLCLYALTLSACFESDIAPSLDPNHLVRVPGLQGIIKFDNDIWRIAEASGYQYEMTKVILAANAYTVPPSSENLSILPLNTPDAPGQHFLVIRAEHVNNPANPRKVIYKYYELRTDGRTFAVNLFDLHEKNPQWEESTRIAARHGVTLGDTGAGILMKGSLTSQNLQALFSDPAFRKNVLSNYMSLQRLSDEQVATLRAAAIAELRNTATRNPSPPPPSMNEDIPQWIGGAALFLGILGALSNGSSGKDRSSSGAAGSDNDVPSDYDRQQQFNKEREKYWRDCATWKSLC